MSKLQLSEPTRTNRAATLAPASPPSAIARFILVAGLAGFGLVALAMHDTAPAGRSPAAPGALVGGFVDDGSNDPEVQLALLADESYFRADAAAGTPVTRVTATAPVVVAAAPAPDEYLPARVRIDPWAAEGNVPTYEHD